MSVQNTLTCTAAAGLLHASPEILAMMWGRSTVNTGALFSMSAQYSRPEIVSAARLNSPDDIKSIIKREI